MGKILSEKNGNRKFERSGRFNEVLYTVISRKNALAKYADNYDTDDKKLFLTYIRTANRTVPLKPYQTLEVPIVLDEFVTLTKFNPEDGTYLEEKGDKVKQYWEIK